MDWLKITARFGSIGSRAVASAGPESRVLECDRRRVPCSRVFQVFQTLRVTVQHVRDSRGQGCRDLLWRRWNKEVTSSSWSLCGTEEMHDEVSHRSSFWTKEINEIKATILKLKAKTSVANKTYIFSQFVSYYF